MKPENIHIIYTQLCAIWYIVSFFIGDKNRKDGKLEDIYIVVADNSSNSYAIFNDILGVGRNENIIMCTYQD